MWVHKRNSRRTPRCWGTDRSHRQYSDCQGSQFDGRAVRMYNSCVSLTLYTDNNRMLPHRFANSMP